MFRFLRFAALAVLASCLFALPFLKSSAVNTGLVTVIVELRDDPGAVYAAKLNQQGAVVSDDQMQAYRQGLKVAQDKFLAQLSSSGQTFQVQSVNVSNVKIEMRYTLVYDGVALKVPASSIDTIKSMPQVKGVHPNTRFFTTLEKSVPYIRAPEVYGSFPELSQFDTEREGYEGQGMYISIIDTGVDWTHPMFGGDPTPPRLGVAPVSTSVPTNPKVVYYLPLTDSAVADGFGHGTHVASTAAGYLAKAPGPDGLPNTADDIQIHGVAPQAKLMSYKVCSDVESTVSSLAAPIGGCDTSNIIMAIEDSVSAFTVTGFAKPKAHVINMSLGGGGGPNEPTAIASDNAVKLGTTVVAAAGNSGPDENTLGAPAAGSRVIAVAADTDPASHFNWSVDALAPSAFPQTTTGVVTPASDFAGQSCIDRIKVFAQAGTPRPPDGAIAQYYVLVDNPLVAWPASVSGRIALINNSGLASATFADICNQAVAAGAVGVLLKSKVTAPTAVKCSVPAANIPLADADRLIGAMPAQTNGALSSFPLRINNDWHVPFVGDTADFSSRGPVAGYGQVKPDVSAPGANILAAMPPASVLGLLSQGNYGAISGTSMASPHTAGATALVMQAHLGWNPDMIRTALINTATNMRDEFNHAKADGLNSESINDQGGGLIDVYAAVNTKGLMGVTGDGVNTPTILGSYSYGAVPVVNSRVTYTAPVTVTIKDVSGQGGTYNLAVANNRDLQQAGVGATLSDTSVSVPANGTATFTLNASVDGNLIRDPNISEAPVTNCNTVNFTVRKMQMQWYVTATRSGSGEKLRMPFYLRPTPSLPANPVITPQNFSGILPGGDAAQQLVSGVTYIDQTFTVSPGVYRIDARLDYTAQSVEDLDFYLYGPDDKEVAHSAISGGPEQFSADISQPGNYRYRIVGYANGPVQYTIAAQLFAGPAAPTMQTIPGDYTNATGDHVDFDGAFDLRWTPQGGEQGFEIEQSTDNQNWSLLADVGAGATSYSLSNQASGTYYFRIRGLAAGAIGQYVTTPSTATSIVVDQRSKVDITSLVSRAVSNVSINANVFQLDLALTNNSAQNYLPLVDLNVIGYSSGSGTIRAINADNGKSGTSPANPALFGYSQKIGSDQIFSANEVTSARTLRFQDNAQELFTFDAVVTAYVSAGGSSSSSSSSSTSSSASPPSSGSPSTAGILKQINAVMRFTANPLTKTVTVQLVSLK
jgi:minor extracellular serine protease Vpr